MTKQTQINFRPSQQALKNLQTIQAISGANQTAVIEMAVAFFANTLIKGDDEMDTIDFVIPTDLDNYGSESSEQTVDEFEKFAKTYLKSLGYNAHTYRAQAIPNDDDYDLRLSVWTAFCRS